MQIVFIDNTNVSQPITTNIGSPQGCILSPFLFSLYTNEMRSHHKDVNVIKYAEDTLIMGQIYDDDDIQYVTAINYIIEWCCENQLHLNERKTKELIIDFRKNKNPYQNVKINHSHVEVVSNFKYLGLTIDNKLSFDIQAQNIIRKIAQRRHLVFQLHNLNVERRIITTAYNAFVRTVIQYCLPCYYFFLKKKYQDKLKRSFERYSSVNTPSMDQYLTSASLNFIHHLHAMKNHSLNDYLQFLPSGHRLSVPFCRTSRFQKSLVVQSILKWNNEKKR